MIKFLKKIYIFIKSEKLFFPPKNKKILVFDGNNNPFEHYILKNDMEVLFTRGEKINLFILLKCLLKNKLDVNNYLKEYIKYVNPKLILTFIDNSRIFYSIHKIANCKTAFVQNGIRSEWSDIFSEKSVVQKKNLNKFRVDYMFVFNNTIGKLYNSFISGKYITIGSFNNNIRKKNKAKKKKEILLISTYRDYNLNRIIDKNKNVTWGEFTKNDHFFIKWLNEFAEKDGIKINILGRYSIKKTKMEFEYFKKFFKKKNFNYISNYAGRDTYKIVDGYEYIFTIDSTLGIESFARGIRTGFFANRPNRHPIVTRKFGWMEKLRNNGPFWTHLNNKKQLKRIYNTVVNIDYSKWKKVSKKYEKKIMPFDEKNKIFNKIIKKIVNK